MSHFTEVMPAGHEPDPVVFDPTAPDAAHAALVMTHAVRDLSHEVSVPEVALGVVDQARESALLAHVVPIHEVTEKAAATHRLEAAYEATGAAAVPEDFDDNGNPRTIWQPHSATELQEAQKPIVFDPEAARITAAALHRMARRNLTSLKSEDRAGRKEARDVLGEVFGERHPVHEAASHVVSGALRAGRLAVMPAVLLTKISRKR